MKQLSNEYSWLTVQFKIWSCLYLCVPSCLQLCTSPLPQISYECILIHSFWIILGSKSISEVYIIIFI